MNVISRDLTIHGLLSTPKEQFQVPSYQRRYAWKQNQHAALFEDIDMLLDNDGHLFGMLILHTGYHHGGINTIKVVDGQQRLTTISILLYVIYQKLNELKDKYQSSQIKQLLYCGNPETSKITKLTLGQLDNPDYLNLLNNKFSEIKNQNILDAFSLFTQLVNKRISEDKNNWLEKFLNKLIHTAVVIRLDVPGAKDAYKLFETINNRGLRLSATDILKNFILGHAAKISDEKLEESRNLWSKLIIVLDGISTDDFFRQYISSVYTRKITKNKLIVEFKKHYFKNVLEVEKLGEYNYNFGEDESDEDSDEDESDEIEVDISNIDSKNEESFRIDIADYLQNILNSAECYANIQKQKFADKKINEKLSDLASIKSFPSYIFLMKYLQDLSNKKEALEILHMIGVLMLRRHITGKRTSENDDIFANLLRIERSDHYVQDIKNKFLEYYPNDDDFIDKFPTHEFKQRVIARARYILSKIENHITGNTNELSINSTLDVHVEHIIPQTITTKKSKEEFGNWEEYLGEKAIINHKKQVNRIGNLTLLSSELNIIASNNPFLSKKKFYKQSNIQLTNDLIKLNLFKIKQLKDRGIKLATAAVEIWKL